MAYNIGKGGGKINDGISGIPAEGSQPHWKLDADVQTVRLSVLRCGAPLRRGFFSEAGFLNCESHSQNAIGIIA
jgi:hypothetical protein